MFAFFCLMFYNLNMTEKQKEVNLKLDAMLEFIKENCIFLDWRDACGRVTNPVISYLSSV